MQSFRFLVLSAAATLAFAPVMVPMAAAQPPDGGVPDASTPPSPSPMGDTGGPSQAAPVPAAQSPTAAPAPAPTAPAPATSPATPQPASPTAIQPAPAPPPSPSPATAAPAQTAPETAAATAPLDQRPATAPPPPPAGQSPAEREEKKKEEKHSELFWIEPMFGYSHIDLVQFTQSNFLPQTVHQAENGFTGGVGMGFQIWWVTIGARATASKYPDYYLGTAELDLGLRFPLGPVKPYIRAGLGYAWLGNPNFNNIKASDVKVYGLISEVGAGLDFYVTKALAIGGGMDAAFLRLTRQKISMALPIGNVNLDQNGDSVGFQLRVQAHIGLHF